MTLVVVADRHPDELEADLRRFCAIDDWHALSPMRAAALLEMVLRQPESLTLRALVPDWRWYSLEAQLAAQQVDLLALLLWAQTQDGAKGRNRPDPLMRPGVPGYETPGEAESPDEEALAVEPEYLERVLAAARSSTPDIP